MHAFPLRAGPSALIRPPAPRVCLHVIDAAPEDLPPRPRTRADCAGSPRPCPFVACRHHLALDVNPATGSIRFNFPDVELEDMPETCSLDVADRGGVGLSGAAALLGLGAERLRQLELQALEKLRAVPRLGQLARQANVLPPAWRARHRPAARPAKKADKEPPARRSAPKVVRRPVGPSLGPEASIACDHFGTPGRPAIIPLKTCLQRQDAKWPGKGASIHEWCGSGRCAQGAEYRLRAGYSAVADWASKSKAGRAAYQFFRRDASVQRQKKRLQALSRPEGEVPTIDQPAGGRSPRPAGLELADPEVQEVLANAGP